MKTMKDNMFWFMKAFASFGACALFTLYLVTPGFWGVAFGLAFLLDMLVLLNLYNRAAEHVEETETRLVELDKEGEQENGC